MFRVIRDQREPAGESNGGDGGVGKGKSDPAPGVISLQNSCVARDFPGDLIVFQAPQQLFGGCFFMGPQASVDLDRKSVV